MKTARHLSALLVAMAGFAWMAPAHAVWNGPAGTSCTVTYNGTEVTGKQAWSTKTGRGYWTCCLPGTTCYAAKTNQPITKDLEVRTQDGSIIVAPPREQKIRQKPASKSSL